MAKMILLGPQRTKPLVAAALEALGVDGPVCTVTAGWQEREGEIEELEDQLERKVVDLGLYGLAESLFEQDPEFFAAHHERQKRLQEQQRLYRLRLPCMLEAVCELQQTDGVDPELLETARREALAAVRILDGHHLAQIRRIHSEFRERWPLAQRPTIAASRARLAEVLEQSRALLIAGGHVGVLMSRLRLFEIGSLIGEMPVVAWSAGAMAVSDKIVLFHDHPPQGPNDPEILDQGLGLMRGVVPLPYAGQRLKLDDPLRVALFASRFSPSLCVTLETGSMLHWDGATLSSFNASRCLTREGQVMEVAVL